MTHNISELLQELLSQYKSADITESEFQKLMQDDESLKLQYREWCEDMGYTYKTGYIEYIEEIIENQESVWDSLNEYEE